MVCKEITWSNAFQSTRHVAAHIGYICAKGIDLIPYTDAHTKFYVICSSNKIIKIIVGEYDDFNK
jgi:hypothetical protein